MAENASAASAAGGEGRNAWVKADFLFESVVCDLHLAARAAAGFSMLLTARAASEAKWSLRAWSSRMHDDVLSMQLTLRFHADMGMTAAQATQVSQAYASLAGATAQLSTEAALCETDEAALARCADTWRRLCVVFKTALEGVAPAEAKRLPGPYAADAQTLIALLADAARGNASRVNRFGAIELPRLSQRRRAPRAAVRHACTLATAAGRFPAEIEDVSRDGLGLRCKATLQEGQEVTVELAGGRRLKGVVARRQGEQAGLKLSAPLAANDPLFGRG